MLSEIIASSVSSFLFQSPASGQHGGDLGVEVTSTQPAQVTAGAVHLSQVPQNFLSLVEEPKSSPLPEEETELIYSPEAQMFVSQPKNPSGHPDHKEDTVLDKVKHRAAEVMHEVKDLAEDAFKSIKFEELKGKAADAWHAVAGAVGAGPGKELSDDQTETLVAGSDSKLHQTQLANDVRLIRLLFLCFKFFVVSLY